MLETLRLDGRAAIITGSGRGLGKAMAKALAAAGHMVNRGEGGARIPVGGLGEWWELGPLAVYLASHASPRAGVTIPRQSRAFNL